MEFPQKIVIVGAGIFGLSTAIALGQRYPEIDVVVVDRYEPPVADGTSVDTNRCIRFDYPNKLYFKLAYEAVNLIKKDPLISPMFHESGMSFIYDGIDKEWGEKWSKRYENAKMANQSDPSKIVYYADSKKVFQSVHGDNADPLSDKDIGRALEWNRGYTNYSCGYIEATNAIEAYYGRAMSYKNIRFQFKEVEKVVYRKGTNVATGVDFTDGTRLSCDLVIVSAGAWSCKLVDLDTITEQSALAVAWIKISKEEEDKWKNMPITSNMSSGINIFPPFQGEIKCLKRFNGYKNTIRMDNPDPFVSGEKMVSFPRTTKTHRLDWIPQDAEDVLRDALKEIMPSLANRPFDRTKLCWVTDTATDNFLVDYHPKLENVLLATAGSGHAWKFVSIIGDKVVDFIKGTLDADLKHAWSWGEKKNINEVARSNGYGELQEVSAIIRTNPISRF